MLHLSRPECHRLLDRCDKPLHDLVLAALYTGCRVTELLRITAADVECDGPGIYIVPVKCYRPRFVFLPDEGLAFFRHLARGKEPRDPLFFNGAGYTWSTYKYHFKQAVLAAGLPKEFCFHGLRHTYASQLIQAGAPVLVVSEQLGHRNCDKVIRTYGHMAPQVRLAEVRARFTSLVSPPNDGMLFSYDELRRQGRSLPDPCS